MRPAPESHHERAHSTHKEELVRKIKLAPIGALVATALIVVAVAGAGTHMTAMSLTATLNAGQEVPHPHGVGSGAAGKFTATVTGTTLKWKLTWSHLTGAATAAHIHAGKKGVAGAVVVPLCGPCTSPASGTTKVTGAVVKQLQDGTMYVNVHTVKNANGEIRGQVKSSM
jgi:hypothetical protein